MGPHLRRFFASVSNSARRSVRTKNREATVFMSHTLPTPLNFPTLTDNGFNNGFTDWHNGDFNYDGAVNGDDFTIMDNSYGTEGSTTY